MEWKWCWNSGTQVQILCFEDGRDIVIISWLYLTPCWVNSVKKSWWWSSLHFKSPSMACSQRCKNWPTTQDAVKFFKPWVGKESTRSASLLPLWFKISRERTCWEESKQIFQEFKDKKTVQEGTYLAFCVLGASPDGIIDDLLMGQKSFLEFEAKCLFVGWKKIINSYSPLSLTQGWITQDE